MILSRKKAYVSVTDAADIIGCTPGRVRKLLIDGVIAGVKFHERAWAVEKQSAENYARIPQKTGRPRVHA